METYEHCFGMTHSAILLVQTALAASNARTIIGWTDLEDVKQSAIGAKLGKIQLDAVQAASLDMETRSTVFAPHPQPSEVETQEKSTPIQTVPFTLMSMNLNDSTNHGSLDAKKSVPNVTTDFTSTAITYVSHYQIIARLLTSTEIVPTVVKDITSKTVVALPIQKTTALNTVISTFQEDGTQPGLMAVKRFANVAILVTILITTTSALNCPLTALPLNPQENALNAKRVTTSKVIFALKMTITALNTDTLMLQESGGHIGPLDARRFANAVIRDSI